MYTADIPKPQDQIDRTMISQSAALTCQSWKLPLTKPKFIAARRLQPAHRTTQPAGPQAQADHQKVRDLPNPHLRIGNQGFHSQDTPQDATSRELMPPTSRQRGLLRQK